MRPARWSASRRRRAMPETPHHRRCTGALMDQLYERLTALERATPTRPCEKTDRLFEQLSQQEACRQAHELEDRIWSLWCGHDEPEASQKMEQAIRAIAARDFAAAHRLLDDMGLRWADWAEVWNKRATLLFLEERDAESLEDIDRTLSMEPRHFGALCGLGQIAIRQGEPHLALAAFKAATRVNPHLAGAKAAVESLERALRRQCH